MAEEKKNTGPEEAMVTDAPTPENPGDPPAPEQEAEQVTLPGTEEVTDTSKTVIDLSAARKAAKEQPTPEAGGEGPGGDGEKKPARRGRRPKAEQEAPGGGEPKRAGPRKRNRPPRKRRKHRKKRQPPAPQKTRAAEAAPRPALRLALPLCRNSPRSPVTHPVAVRKRLCISI